MLSKEYPLTSSIAAQPPVPRLWLSDLLLLLVAVVWGASYGLAKENVMLYPVLAFLALRFGLTFLLLFPFLLPATTRRATLQAGVPLGLLLLAIFLAETFGVLYTSASNAAFLISLCVVLTPFAEWLLLARRPSWQTFVACTVSMLGAALLTSGVQLAFNLGDGLILLAAVLRAVMVCSARRMTAGRQLSSLGLTAVQSAVMALGCLLAAAILLPGGLPALPHSLKFWGNTAFLVLFCTIFAFFAQNWALRHSSPTRVALLMGSEPLFGALFASFWLGERLSLLSWLGGLCIVGAALWMSWPGAQSHTR